MIILTWAEASLASAFVGVGRIAPDEERLVLETSRAVVFYLWCAKRLSLHLFIMNLLIKTGL